MSNQFTYEIDERKLRMQLKDLEYPLHENSWQKFESYAATRTAQRVSASKGSFRLNLNRNVVLPVVFGAVVISFSFMLVNFINLKPAHKNQESKAEALKPAITGVAEPVEKTPLKMQPVMQMAQPVVSQEKTNPETPVNASSNHSAGMMGDKLESNLVSKPVETPENAMPEVVTPTVEMNIQSQTVVNTDIKSDTEVAKKKHRKSLDPSAQLQEEIRPTVVSDAQEEEVRPN